MMNIVPFILALFAISASVIATGRDVSVEIVPDSASLEFLSNHVAPAMTMFVHHQSRNLGSSLLDDNNLTQCFADTNDLHNDPTLAVPYAAWNNELATEGDLASSEDVCTQNENSFVCEVDSSQLSTHDDLVDACAEVGGTIYLQSDSLYCLIQDSGVEYEFSVSFKNLPHCFASTCDLEKVAEFLDFGEDAVEDYEALLSFIFESVECSSPAPGSYGFRLNASPFGGGIVIAFLWFFMM